jgi:DNA-binding transcriptional MerR regulator
MLSIGEFASMTGLSVKALRHYDEKEVLVPADVDPGTGYRRYGEAQVRAGALARALRDAGVPLPALAVALRDGDTGRALAEHREHVLAERRREDAAFLNAELVLSALSAPVEVVARSCTPQPYVARVIRVDTDGEDGASDDEANEQFAELFAALQADGLGPSGNFWIGLRAGDAPGTAEVWCCWPTARRAPAGWGGDSTTIDQLPSRHELVARWRSIDGGQLPEGSVHPAVVALFDAIAARDIHAISTEVRQTISMNGNDENDYTVEVAVTVADA